MFEAQPTVDWDEVDVEEIVESMAVRSGDEFDEEELAEELEEELEDLMEAAD